MPTRRHPRALLLTLLVAACAVAPLELAEPVRFEGFTALPETNLRELVASDVARYATDKTALGDAAQILAVALRRLGFADATVKGSAEDDGTLLFRATQGRQFTIASLEVTGASAVPREELLRLWRLLPLPNGTFAQRGAFEPGEPYDTPRVDQWVAQVQARYADAGFLDARVPSADAVRNVDDGTVAITLHVAHEGPRYKIRAFEVPDAVRALLGDDMPAPPVDQFCTRANAEGYAAQIVRALRKRGHPEPELRAGATRHSDVGEVTLRLSVEPGPARTVAAIEVRGNRRVPTALIRDKFGVPPQTRFDGEAERRGLAALSATGEFSSLDVRYEPTDDDGLRMVLDTQETSGLVLKGSPYFHPWKRLGYNMFIEGRDALGERHDLLGHVHVGYRGYHVAGRYLYSGLFGDEHTSLSTGGDFFYNHRPAFTDRGAGGTLELRRYFSPGLSAAASYTALEHFDTRVDAESTTTIGRDYTEGRASLLLDFDRTDNRLLPTRGDRLFARVDRVDPALGADVEFTRLRVGAGLWLPLHEQWRWSIEAESGWLWPGENSAQIPIPERFFLGGWDTVRSFRESRLGPRDATGALRGGEFRNFARTELTYRLLEPLELALFGDAGNVGVDVNGWTFDDMRYALGFGVRLLSRETGPVIVSAAWNPDRERGEHEWVVDFAAGVNF